MHDRGAGPEERHTTVVFIHGIGEQRRHEDSARLASALSRRALLAGIPLDGPEIDRVPDPAHPTDPERRTVASLRMWFGATPVRFDDVYWAPLVAGLTNFRSLQQWLRGKAARPFRVLFAPWASHTRLKIEMLQQNRNALDAL